jgi:hypothetical protein
MMTAAGGLSAWAAGEQQLQPEEEARGRVVRFSMFMSVPFLEAGLMGAGVERL